MPEQGAATEIYCGDFSRTSRGCRLQDWQLQMALGQAIRYFQDQSDRTIIGRGAICADEARLHGIIVSDDAVTDFLRSLTQDQVTAQRFTMALESIGSAQRGTVTEDALQTRCVQELLALNSASCSVRDWC